MQKCLRILTVLVMLSTPTLLASCQEDTTQIKPKAERAETAQMEIRKSVGLGEGVVEDID